MFHRHLSNPTRHVITGQSPYFNTQRFAESVFLGIHERHLQCPSSDFCNLKVEMQYAVLTIFHVSHHAGKSTITNRNDMPSRKKNCPLDRGRHAACNCGCTDCRVRCDFAEFIGTGCKRGCRANMKATSNFPGLAVRFLFLDPRPTSQYTPNFLRPSRRTSCQCSTARRKQWRS